MGRKLPIDENLVADMALSGCPNTEIAALLGCDEGTIRKRFSDLLVKKRAERCWILRKKQIELAEAGNPTMLIWLGKNILNQRDSQDVQHEGTVKLEVTYVNANHHTHRTAEAPRLSAASEN